MLSHKFFIEDDAVREIKDFRSPWGIEIYEVVRVMERVPLFLEDHLKRFYHSAWLLHLEIPLKPEQIRQMLRKLIEVNGADKGNIRFSWAFRPAGKFQACFIPHHYPGMKEYLHGVDCGVLHAERSDPNAKVVQVEVRAAADRMIRELGLYEILLVNRDGCITEGSRSNLFFIREGVFYTSPDEEVLPGITRQKAMELIREWGWKLVTRSVVISDLENMEAAFLTGTSPKVLPIRRVDDLIFPIGRPEVDQLGEAYNALISGYIKKNR